MGSINEKMVPGRNGPPAMGRSPSSSPPVSPAPPSAAPPARPVHGICRRPPYMLQEVCNGLFDALFTSCAGQRHGPRRCHAHNAPPRFPLGLRTRRRCSTGFVAEHPILTRISAAKSLRGRRRKGSARERRGAGRQGYRAGPSPPRVSISTGARRGRERKDDGLHLRPPGRAAQSSPRPSSMIYFAIIFLATLPLATITWALSRDPPGRFDRERPDQAVLAPGATARIITPNDLFPA